MGDLFILLIFVCVILFFLFLLISVDYDTCYRENIRAGIADEDGCCGLLGGDRNTNYLQYDCIGCPYLKLINKEE